MPNERSGLFSQKKILWRKIYLNNMRRALNDPETATQALVGREGTEKLVQGVWRICPGLEIEAALDAIDANDNTVFRTNELVRAKASLLDAGFGEVEINRMPKSFVLKADAALSYAKSNKLLDSMQKPYQADMMNQELYVQSIMQEDLKHFNKELLQFGKTLLNFQFAIELINQELSDLDNTSPAYMILTELKENLNALQETIDISELDFQDFIKNYQDFLITARSKLEALPKQENNPDYSLIFLAIKPRSGLELLQDTFYNNTESTKALGRTLLAMDTGTLSVNGEQPDASYPLGEYLIHGGRVKFDLHDLTGEEQEQFFQFITAGQAKSRSFATHRGGGTDASGSPAEIKSGLWGAIVDAGRALIGRSRHYGINLAVGGNSIPSREGQSDCHGQLPDESGKWGHMYMRKDKDILLIGIEASAPGTTNLRTKEEHSKVGGTGERSAFLELKIDSKALHEEQTAAGKTPLSTTVKTNWATIKVTKEEFQAMQEKAVDTYEAHNENTRYNYSKLVNQAPQLALKAGEAPLKGRIERMNAWAKATKQGNKPSAGARIFGALLVVAGVVLSAVPIPVVTQLMGGSLAALGVGIATGVVGVAAATYTSSTKAAKLYNKSQLKKESLPPAEEVLGNSNQVMAAAGLMEEKKEEQAPEEKHSPRIRTILRETVKEHPLSPEPDSSSSFGPK